MTMEAAAQARPRARKTRKSLFFMRGGGRLGLGACWYIKNISLSINSNEYDGLIYQ